MGMSLKRALKKAMADRLPAEILHRSKRGFGMPLDRWFRTDLRSYLQGTLGVPTARVRAHSSHALDALLASTTAAGRTTVTPCGPCSPWSYFFGRRNGDRPGGQAGHQAQHWRPGPPGAAADPGPEPGISRPCWRRASRLGGGELGDPAVPVYPVPLTRAVRPGSDLAAFVAVRNLLRSTEARLLHTHMAKAGTIGRAAAALVPDRPRTIHTFHGLVLDGYFVPCHAARLPGDRAAAGQAHRRPARRSAPRSGPASSTLASAAPRRSTCSLWGWTSPPSWRSAARPAPSGPNSVLIPNAP